MFLFWVLGGAGILGFLAYENKQAIGDVVEENVPSWSTYDSLFASNAWGVNPRWLKAFALNESDNGQNSSVAAGIADPTDVQGSTSSDGKSWGLMQVTLSTGGGYDPSITPEKLNDPAYSVDIAAHLVRDLSKQFDPSVPENLEWIVKSYNQGAGNTKKEIAGLIAGYAQDYWERWQRNFDRVNSNPGNL